MSKTTKTPATENPPEAGQDSPASVGQATTPTPTPATPASGGRYKRATDGTLTPIEE